MTVLEAARKLVPPLLSSFHKGQLGRILVVGGSMDYTGAPYFACMASALTGSDMNHILCSSEAGPVIKTYSPNLMVHPYLVEGHQPESDSTGHQLDSRIPKLLDRIHVVVLGPGLGRDEGMLAQAKAVLEEAKKRKIAVIVDADGLWAVARDLDLTKGLDIVLTPNIVEFDRLAKAACVDRNLQLRQQAEELATKLGATIVLKGEHDIITNGKETLFNDTPGSSRRVSGQGDTLAGSIATFLAWRRAYSDRLWQGKPIDADLKVLACWSGSTLTRTASNLAFAKHGRGMVTSDVTAQVPIAFKQLFETD